MSPGARIYRLPPQTRGTLKGENPATAGAQIIDISQAWGLFS